jgi:hypothetical protein
MEQQTRVKKYAQLREMIAQDHEETNFHDALAPFAKRLSAVDEKFNVDPERAAYKDYVPEHAKSKAYQDLFDEDSEDLITNDFLEQFINEVKSYNVNEGTRVAQETTENVLHTYMQQPKESKDLSINQQNLKKEELSSNEYLPKEEEYPPFEQDLSEEDDRLVDEVLERIESNAILSSSNNKRDDQEWVTQTQQLTEAVETMGSSISSVNEKIIATNRLVNFLLAIFILGLIIVSGYIVYMILGFNGLL